MTSGVKNGIIEFTPTTKKIFKKNIKKDLTFI